MSGRLGDWNAVWLTHDQQIPENTNYFKLVAVEGTQTVWTPRIPTVTITYLGDLNTVEEVDLALVPDEFSLQQNFPNPFNPETTINYTLPVSADIELKIFDILGRHVKTLVNRKEHPGSYSIKWNGKDKFENQVASGVYFYRLDAKSDI